LRSDNGAEFIAKSLQGFLSDHGTRPFDRPPKGDPIVSREWDHITAFRRVA
jgi:transposase InsO family protein